MGTKKKDILVLHATPQVLHQRVLAVYVARGQKLIRHEAVVVLRPDMRYKRKRKSWGANESQNECMKNE